MRQISQTEHEPDDCVEEAKRRAPMLRAESVISNKDAINGKVVLQEHTESGEYTS